jgi:hypothetical protein
VKLFGRVGAIVVGLGLVASACGSSAKSTATQRVSDTHPQPTAIVPVSSGAVSLGPLQANGTFAILAGTPSTKGVFIYDLATHHEVGSYSVSALADSVTELPDGIIAVGLSGQGVGAVDLYSNSRNVVASVPVAGPVISLALATNGNGILVLEGTQSSRAVAILDTTTRVATTTIPVASNTVAVVDSAHGHELYGLGSSGTVSVYASATGQEIGGFPVGHSGSSLTLAPNGTQLYVLKGRRDVRNVAVVDLNTQRDLRALPAPAGAVTLQPSLGGQHLLELASVAASSNVQEWPLS